MSEEQDNWKKLVNITEEYQPDIALADKAILKLEQKENIKVKKSFSKKIGLLVCAMACIIGVAIFLPVYLSTIPSPIIYYSDDNIEYSNIENIEYFLAENELDIRYFDYDTTSSKCAKLIENGKVAYITQEMFYMDETNFDYISLKIVVLTNTRYSFYENYETLPQQETVFNIPVSYNVYIDNQGVEYQTKFEYENKQYFLNIKTYEENIGKISQYIELLINN